MSDRWPSRSVLCICDEWPVEVNEYCLLEYDPQLY